MDKVKPNSEPETLDASSTFGGRCPLTGSLPATSLCYCRDSVIRWVDESRPHVSGITGPGWFCTGCLREFVRANVSDQIPRTQDVANTTDSPERLSASDLFGLGVRFRREVLGKAGITWAEVAKHDPQEMALFCFLVGAGLTWEEARMVENLDLGDEPNMNYPEANSR